MEQTETDELTRVDRVGSNIYKANSGTTSLVIETRLCLALTLRDDGLPIEGGDGEYQYLAAPDSVLIEPADAPLVSLLIGFATALLRARAKLPITGTAVAPPVRLTSPEGAWPRR